MLEHRTAENSMLTRYARSLLDKGVGVEEVRARTGRLLRRYQGASERSGVTLPLLSEATPLIPSAPEMPVQVAQKPSEHPLTSKIKYLYYLNDEDVRKPYVQLNHFYFKAGLVAFSALHMLGRVIDSPDLALESARFVSITATFGLLSLPLARLIDRISLKKTLTSTGQPLVFNG